MPRLSRLLFLTLSTASLCQFMTLSSLAADFNTYRAGLPYLKTAAGNYGQCEMQCQGDAACRGWNFVKPNPRAASGICEFNARMAMPVASPVSISGVVSTSIDPLMSRAVSAGANTIRVGAPPTVVRKAPQRIVRRQPIPRPNQAVRTAAHTRPAPQVQNKLAPRVYGEVTPKTAPPTNTNKLTPQQQYYRQQYLAQKHRQDQQRARQIAARLAPRQMPRPAQQQARRHAPQMQTPAQKPQAPVPLYGSLHDDLTKMTSVPRPQTAPDNLNNPDAPVSTSRAAPTRPVETAPLQAPVLPGLAGG